MIDSIDRENFYGLAVRIVQGNFTTFVNNGAIKYFNLTIVSMVMNCSPFITLWLASYYLKEKIQD